MSILYFASCQILFSFYKALFFGLLDTFICPVPLFFVVLFHKHGKELHILFKSVIIMIGRWALRQEAVHMAKPLQDLTLMNDFLFSVVMRQEQFCRPLLEYILKVKIRKIVYVGDQEAIQVGVPDAKSVRLDVYIEDDENTVYDLEVQTTDKRNLGKRTRYYQSMIDIRVLEKGQDYKRLKKSYVIFICNYDPYGKSRYVYNFRNRCE